MKTQPSKEIWKKLYDAAVRFKSLAPWQWMWDSQLFGVEDPAGGDTGYCCIMGNLGEHFGMMVYLGGEGFRQYCRLQDADGDTGAHEDVAFAQSGLMASFEDRDLLSPEDRAVIKELGRSFRGKDAWPMFRSHRPGYFPWYLEMKEAVFLTVCLEQAVDVAGRLKDNPDLLDPPDGEKIFVRSCRTIRGEIVWEDAFRDPQPPLREMVSIQTPVPEEFYEALKDKRILDDSVWEADAYYIPSPVRDGDERPYFPLSLVLVDQASFFILDAHVTSVRKRMLDFIDLFIRAVQNHDTLPARIHARDPYLYGLLTGLLKNVAVKVEHTDVLPAADDVKAAMRKEMFGWEG